MKKENKSEAVYAVPYLYEQLRKKSVAEPAPAAISSTDAELLKVEVPGSKSITNRALLLATLANGTSTLRGVLFSDDSRHFLKCVQELGFHTTVDEDKKMITVTGRGGEVPRKEASLYVGSAGTAARFLTAYLGLSQGTYHMDASAQMRRRPMAPLLNSLKELGCGVSYEPFPTAADSENNPADLKKEPSKEGFFPFTLQGNGFGQNHITVNIDESSQFLSALLIASCLSAEDFTVSLEGTHGMAYVTMTAQMMAQFGVKTTLIENRSRDEKSNHPEAEATGANPVAYCTPAGQHYKALDYQIEPDVSAACYFYGMSPLLGIPVQVSHVHFNSLQGDVEFLRILEKMGCTVQEESEGIIVYPPRDGSFRGVHADMHTCSDQAITLAALAPFAKEPTTISGIGHIRFQESDRISAIVTELRKMGIRCDESESSITIYPGNPAPSVVETYDDHRMAMGFSLIGLRAPGITIKDPDCCRKTFENYFSVLDRVVAQLTANQ